MTDRDRLEDLLRSAVPPLEVATPSRDLWPSVTARSQVPMKWSWLDMGICTVVAVVLLMFPDWMWVLAYHL